MTTNVASNSTKQAPASEIKIKMILEESPATPGVRFRREEPREHDGRIEAHEVPHNAAS